jgi:hypothetical protein
MRGYFFSILIGMLLALFIVVMDTSVVSRPVPAIAPFVAESKNAAALGVAPEVAAEFFVNATNAPGGGLLVTDGRSSTVLSTTQARIADWRTLVDSRYAGYAQHNLSIENNNVSTYLNAGLFKMFDGNVNYEWRSTSFTFNHTLASVNLTVIPGTTVFNTACGLDTSGDVAVRVMVANFDSTAKFVKRNTTYSCFVNFTTSGNFTAYFQNGDFVVDYSQMPSSNFVQMLTINPATSFFVPSFGEENITTSGTKPASWNESFNGTKRYGDGTSHNFVISDTDSNGVYDSAFVDSNNDGMFNDTYDPWYVERGAVNLGGKAFYIRFDSSGNWVREDKILAVIAGNATTAVVIRNG